MSGLFRPELDDRRPAEICDLQLGEGFAAQPVLTQSFAETGEGLDGGFAPVGPALSASRKNDVRAVKDDFRHFFNEGGRPGKITHTWSPVSSNRQASGANFIICVKDLNRITNSRVTPLLTAIGRPASHRAPAYSTPAT